MSETGEICDEAKNAQDRISNEIKEVKSAWQARFQKGEEFLANKSKINPLGENGQLIILFDFAKNG